MSRSRSAHIPLPLDWPPADYVVLTSAYKHGFDSDDIDVALADTYGVSVENDDPKIWVFGPDRRGNLIEIIFVKLDDGNYAAIHVDRLRPSIEKQIRRSEWM